MNIILYKARVWELCKTPNTKRVQCASAPTPGQPPRATELEHALPARVSTLQHVWAHGPQAYPGEDLKWAQLAQKVKGIKQSGLENKSLTTLAAHHSPGHSHGPGAEEALVTPLRPGISAVLPGGLGWNFPWLNTWARLSHARLLTVLCWRCSRGRAPGRAGGLLQRDGRQSRQWRKEGGPCRA